MIELRDALVTDALPGILAQKPWVQAYAYAVKRQTDKILRYSQRLNIWNAIDTIDSDLCNALALELRTPQYDTALPLATRRELVKNTLVYYALAGTRGAVKKLTSDIFGSSDVLEWFEYGGEPGYFKVTTDNPAVTEDNVDEFRRTAEAVKRLSAHLEKVEITLDTEAMAQMHAFGLHMGTKMTLRQEG